MSDNKCKRSVMFKIYNTLCSVFLNTNLSKCSDLAWRIWFNILAVVGLTTAVVLCSDETKDCSHAAGRQCGAPRRPTLLSMYLCVVLTPRPTGSNEFMLRSDQSLRIIGFCCA